MNASGKDNEKGDTDNANANSWLSEEDPGVPLFDTNERATLFGLEPNAELDSMDNGLMYTGPFILFFSIYFTISLLFGDDVPLL